MQHARQHAQTRVRERRQQIANEAARLISEAGIRDYHQAKLKAARRLGIHDDASLPHNHEIEQALHQYQRLFSGPRHDHDLRTRRAAALEAMVFFAAFEPRLVGPVLEGTADAHAPVNLHLHCDDADAVMHFLHEQHVQADDHARRLRMDRERSLDVPVWMFDADGIAFDVAVLPLDALRQAPLSGVDQRPMRRASATQLRMLLAGAHQGS